MLVDFSTGVIGDDKERAVQNVMITNPRSIWPDAMVPYKLDKSISKQL